MRKPFYIPLILLAFLALALASSVEPGAAPKLPYIDQKACPFECCRFGDWNAERELQVYDGWERGSRKPRFTLKRGEVVKALTGIHVTYRPGRVRINADMPKLKLRAGQIVDTYMYTGEGYVHFWANGKMQNEELESAADCSVASSPSCIVDKGDKEWWVKIRTKSGQVGWVFGNVVDFSGNDACG